jgi:predicted peptidase
MGRQTAELFQKEISQIFQLNYLLYLPDDYSEGTPLPLVLFLHGAGERGNDLGKLGKHGPPKLVDGGQAFPFVLVSPQCPEDSWWKPDALMALVDEIVETHAIDEDRIYVTGLSMGGYGTWALAGDYADRFAAIAPICGGGTRQHARRIAQAKIPTWVFHGAKDATVPFDESERLVNLMKKFEGDVKLTVYPDAGHDAWTETYDNPEVFEWLLSHKRSSAS